ncbi:MAG: paraquat-inducible protein A [Betaproteobacteria bacterium]|nr:paraquat-inducible protein A [Betaproteobacteria bacterium]
MRPLALDSIACPDCDLQQVVPPLPPGGSARCARCAVTIARNPVDPIDRPLALTVAAALAFAVANMTPLMGLSAVGLETTTTLMGGAREMWSQGSEVTAAIVAFSAVIAPGCFIAFMLIVLLAARRPPAPRWVGRLMRVASFVQPWSMSDVMLLGILVALIKIAQLATVVPGIGMYAVGLLVLLLAAISATFDSHAIWKRVVWADGTPPPDSPGTQAPWRGATTAPAPGAARTGLASCATCRLLSRPYGPGQPGHCPRCGATLAPHHRHSIQYTWALLIAAAILYVPANALPVLITTTLGSSEPDTIISGVASLYETGSWPLALIVLIASVMIPMGKVVALAYLLATVQHGSVRSNHDRARLYRLIDFIGRWSMLDVFVVAFSVALVQLRPMMSVAPGPGVVFFMAVVVLTMFAAHSFDQRLIWNPGNLQRSPHG